MAEFKSNKRWRYCWDFKHSSGAEEKRWRVGIALARKGMRTLDKGKVIGPEQAEEGKRKSWRFKERRS